MNSQNIIKSIISITLITMGIMQSSIVYSESPKFVRQEISDDSGDWEFWPPKSDAVYLNTHQGKLVLVPTATNRDYCVENTSLLSPDIESLSYQSNGKTLNGTMWLSSIFHEPPINDTLALYDPFQERISIIVRAVDGNETLEHFNTNYDLERENALNKSKVNVTFLNKPAYKVDYVQKVGHLTKNVTEILTLVDNKAYVMTYTALNETYKTYWPAAKKIIDSFTVSKNISYPKQDSSQNSSIYESHGIRFQYPSGWIEQDGPPGDENVVSFRSPFTDPNLPLGRDIKFIMAIDLPSVQDTGIDYRVQYSTMIGKNFTGNWTRQVYEVSANDKIKTMHTPTPVSILFRDNRYYIPFSFNLDEVNSPTGYKVLFYIQDSFVLRHQFCRLVDTTNWVLVPPPSFVISSLPHSAQLRPGEKESVTVQVKGNSNLEAEASLFVNNTNKNVNASFIPSKISIPPLSGNTAIMHLELHPNSDVMEPTPIIFPIQANISFPTTITNRGGDTFTNNKSIILPESSNFTLTIMPHYTADEQLNSFVKSWITPVSGLWTFLAGVGAVVAPLIVRFYRKKQK